MMKFLIINQHTLNMGDDAAGVALALQVREFFKDSEIHFVYNHQKEVQGVPFKGDKVFHHNIIITKKDFVEVIAYFISRIIPAVKPKGNIKRYLDLLADADFVVVSPCGANIGIYKDKPFLIRVLLAVLEGKKPLFHLNTIGRSGSFLFDSIAKFVLKRSEVFVREGKSYKEMQKWGIKCQRGVDTAFSLPERTEVKKAPLEKDGDYIVFIPTDLQLYFPNFPNKNVNSHLEKQLIPKLKEFCVQNNLKVKILPHALDYDGRFEKIVEYMKLAFIEAGFEEKEVLIAEEMSDFSDYEKIIKNSKLVISMRYHGVIFAIRNTVPFIALSYENKMREACCYSQMTRFYVDLKKPDGTDYERILRTISNEYDCIKNILHSKKAFYDRMSRLPIQKLYLEYLSGIS